MKPLRFLSVLLLYLASLPPAWAIYDLASVDIKMGGGNTQFCLGLDTPYPFANLYLVAT